MLFHPGHTLRQSLLQQECLAQSGAQAPWDVCTPMQTAWDLHRAFPEADFHIVDEAGHAFDEPGITDRLVRTTNQYATD